MKLALWPLLAAVPLMAQEAGPPAADAVRIREAHRLAREIADSVWPGSWQRTPFPILLVTAEREYLVGFPRLPQGFTGGRESPAVAASLAERPRQFDPKLLAAFPAFGPPAVVVVGQPEATGKASVPWVLTLLHEHFHQYQSHDPGYYAAVEALGLSGGDQSGMWMLNYPFPYDSAPIAATFATLSRDLAQLVERSTAAERAAFWGRYRAFLDRLAEPDRRYLGFQLWQEGIARYVEMAAAEVASRRYRPTPEFAALPDVEPFAVVGAKLRAAMLAELAAADLPTQRRVSFYQFGAALGVLLDRDAPGWKGRYQTERFALEGYLRR